MSGDIGALWCSTGKNSGKDYFSGNVEINGEKIKIVVFHNRDKSSSNNYPDYLIYKSRPMEEKSSEPKSVFTDENMNE